MRRRLFAAILFVFCLTGVSRADTLFNVNGTFESGGTFSGTFELNPANDVMDALNLNLNADGFNVALTLTHNLAGYGDIALGEANFGNNVFSLVVSTDSVLLPHLCTPQAPNCNTSDRGLPYSILYYNSGLNSDPVVSGTITNPALASATPEPSSLLLLATGCLGLESLRRRNSFSHR